MTRTTHFRIYVSLVSVLVVGKVFAGCIEQPDSCDQAAAHQIVITGFKFVPDQLQVAAGDTITWINKDIVPHSIFIDKTQKTISPELKSGQEFRFVVDNPLDYSCGLHPSMKGKLSLINEHGETD